MLSLPELSQTYKNSHPHYINPLAYYSPEDRELEKIKRTALSPYLQQLEEQMIIFKDIITVFAVLYEVVVDELGFSAEVWRMQPIHVPVYAEHLAERNSWVIGCGWPQLRFLQDRINCMPWGWSFWPEKRVIQSVEDSFMHGDSLATQNALRNSVCLYNTFIFKLKVMVRNTFGLHIAIPRYCLIFTKTMPIAAPSF